MKQKIKILLRNLQQNDFFQGNRSKRLYAITNNVAFHEDGSYESFFINTFAVTRLTKEAYCREFLLRNCIYCN